MREGSCLCGAVRYELGGEPLIVGLCHCADCRKESGSVMTFYAKWPLASFRYGGEIRTFAGRSFCPTCGSRLFCLQEETVEIRLGSLDDAPTGLTPVQEGWTIRREAWLAPVIGCTQAAKDP